MSRSKSKQASRERKRPEAQPAAQPVPRRGRNWLRTAGLILGLALVAGLAVGAKPLSEMWAVHWIDKNLDTFLDEPKTPLPEKAKGSPYLHGKLLPIDREARRVSDLYYDLPDAMRPDSAAEVGTVAWLEWSSGSKELDGKPFAWRECKLTLIDREKSRVMDECKFRVGGSAVDDKVARRPVLDYLTHLPGAPRKGP